jgi:hypothetical protein
MSTAIVTHHRFIDPLAAAAAVVVVVGGASVVGVAMSQSDTATRAPSAPAQVSPDHPSRIGLGDFQQSSNQGASTPLKGGHTVIGLP